MAATGVGAPESKTGDEVAQELLEADIALGKRMKIAQLVHQLRCSDEVVGDKAGVKKELLALMEERDMAPLYARLVEELGWTVDPAYSAGLTERSTKKLGELQAEETKNQDEFGDSELFDAACAKAAYLADIGSSAEAVKAYTEMDLGHSSSGQRVDVLMATALAHMFEGEFGEAKTSIEAAKALNAKGGDWDRRNRLKVYEAVVALSARDFDTASKQLLDVLATFTCYEVCDYPTFITYAVLAAMVTLPRIQLKARVVDSPDVLSVIRDIPHLEPLLTCLYSADYAGFMAALVAIHPTLQKDRFLAPHAAYWVREVRVRAYGQYLDAYRSVTLASMAAAFGVQTLFLDGELSRFIAARRLHAKIDRVGGIVETTRADAKSAQYTALLKSGDSLLNRVQRLSRVVSV